jgi:hypothetical protein
MEGLFSSKELVRRDIEQVYKGLYIDAFTSLEQSIETLFIGLLVGNIAPNSNQVRPKVMFDSYQTARSVVYAGRPYVDWLPYEKTEDRAKIFFRGGKPFSCLSKQQISKHQLSDRQKLQRLQYVRNAIAHKSKYSVRVFENKVIDGRPINYSYEKRPAGFMRVTYRNNPAQTWYELFVSEMVDVLRTIAEFR